MLDLLMLLFGSTQTKRSPARLSLWFRILPDASASTSITRPPPMIQAVFIWTPSRPVITGSLHGTMFRRTPGRIRTSFECTNILASRFGSSKARGNTLNWTLSRHVSFSGPAHFNTERRALKSQLQRELHDPWILRAQDLPELRAVARRHDHVCTRPGTEAVGQVKSFRAQFETR